MKNKIYTSILALVVLITLGVFSRFLPFDEDWQLQSAVFVFVIYLFAFIFINLKK